MKLGAKIVIEGNPGANEKTVNSFVSTYIDFYNEFNKLVDFEKWNDEYKELHPEITKIEKGTPEYDDYGFFISEKYNEVIADMEICKDEGHFYAYNDHGEPLVAFRPYYFPEMRLHLEYCSQN